MQHDRKTCENSDVRGINYSDKLQSYVHKKSRVGATQAAATTTVKILTAEYSTTCNNDDDTNRETDT
jgi:hypothetical protein